VPTNATSADRQSGS